MVAAVSRMTGSYLLGLLVGYGWLASSDWGGSLGKWITRLEVRFYATGDECSLRASVIRNLPIVISAILPRLVQALLGMERQEYIASHQILFLITSVLGLAASIALWADAANNYEGRHLGDRMAGTIVLGCRKARPINLGEEKDATFFRG